MHPTILTTCMTKVCGVSDGLWGVNTQGLVRAALFCTLFGDTFVSVVKP